MKRIASLVYRNPYVQFLLVVALVLGAYTALHLVGRGVQPVKIHDSLRLATVLPLIFGGALTIVPEAYQSKERRARIFFFVNSNSFKRFMLFWALVSALAFACFAVSLYDFPHKQLFGYLDFAILVAGYACFVVTAIVIGRLLVRSRS